MKEEVKKQIGGFSEIGKTGLDHTAGEIYEEKLRHLQKFKRNLVYQEMIDNDATIGAVLFAIDMLMRRVDHTVKPYSEDARHVEDKDFIESVFDDMNQPFKEVLSEIVGTMLPQGHAPMEMVFKQRDGTIPMSMIKPGTKPSSRFNDGLIGLHKLSLRSPETIDKWNFDENGELLGFTQRAAPKYEDVEIPIWKVLLFRTSAKKNNPEGRSVLRTAYRSWFFKKRIENLEAIGIERDLAGLPMAMVPPEIMSPNAGDQEKTIFNEVKRIVTNIRRDEQEGVVFPMIRDENGNLLYELKLLSTGGSRQFKTTDTINRYRQDIAMSVLADFILIGHEKVGSFSLASSKTSIFTMALKSWLDMIAEIINRKLIPMLFHLNGKPLDELPYLEFEDVETVDLNELGGFITALSGAGIDLTGERAQNYIKSQANIPLDGDGEGA